MTELVLIFGVLFLTILVSVSIAAFGIAAAQKRS